MKILNFGSLNIDNVYTVEEFVRPGETVTAKSHTVFAGGKGLNQSIAAARAGAEVIHGGAIGPDGGFLASLLEEAGADAGHLLQLDIPTGHTVIEVDAGGQNRILVWGGANRGLTHTYLEDVFACGSDGDIVLLQNETSLTDSIIRRAHGLGFRVVFNPSPFPVNPDALSLDDVDMFIVNESEAALLANAAPGTAPATLLEHLHLRFPSADLVVTAGERGTIALLGGAEYVQEAFPVKTVDTTGAGDTFCGYFLAAACAHKSPQAALCEASAAAALAVSRAGAAPSIPQADEVRTFLKKRMFLQQIE